MRTRSGSVAGFAAMLCAMGLGVLAAQPAPSEAATATAAPVAVSLSRTSGQSTDATRVLVRGSGLDQIGSALLGGHEATVEHLGDDRLAIVVPASPHARPRTLDLVLTTASGSDVATGLAFRQVATSPAARQTRWAWRHVHARSYSWGHAYIPEHDCANFASHALVRRGLPSSVLEVSSTALRRKLLALGATELRDSEAARARVRVGDIVQFDWQPSATLRGDRDHTGIVTAVERAAAGRLVVRYLAHTDGGDHAGVDLTVEESMLRPRHDPDGRAYFLRLP